MSGSKRGRPPRETKGYRVEYVEDGWGEKHNIVWFDEPIEPMKAINVVPNGSVTISAPIEQNGRVYFDYVIGYAIPKHDTQ